MRRIFFSLLVLLLCFSANAQEYDYCAGASVAAAKSCAVDSAVIIDKIFTDDYYSQGADANYVWVGQGDFDPGANIVVCQVDHNVRNATGSADYRIEIWTMSGTSLGILASGCTSNSVTISAAGTKQFTGLTCALTNGNLYGIMITRSDNGYGTNFLGAGIFVAIGANMAVSGNEMEFKSDKTRQSSNAADLSMKLYGYTP